MTTLVSCSPTVSELSARPTPRAAPWRAGDDPWPALAIGEGSSTIFVAGRIDRIDTSRDGTRGSGSSTTRPVPFPRGKTSGCGSSSLRSTLTRC